MANDMTKVRALLDDPACRRWTVKRVATLLAVVQGIVFAGCPGPTKPAHAPPVAAAQGDPGAVGASQTHADVFRPLDGRWTGTFRVYVDTEGQRPGSRPFRPDPASFTPPRFELELELAVEQTYASESPYLQRVTIVDRYPDGRTVTSRGVNEVQVGGLVCVVLKPDDVVVHRGSVPAPDTILWQRDRADPQAVERFWEAVEGDTYSIVGWGYYGDDDPAKTPRRYFHAVYRRPGQ